MCIGLVYIYTHIHKKGNEMSNFPHDKTIILFESTFSSTKNIYNLFKYNFNSKKSDRHEIPVPSCFQETAALIFPFASEEVVAFPGI